MKLFKMTMYIGAAVLVAGCGSQKSDFRYTVDQFADVKVIRYQIPGWEDLNLQQKEYAYHLAEAAKWGRDILWDQNCRYNLSLRRMLEKVYLAYERGELKAEDSQARKEVEAFKVYVKRVWFANGVHHHYSTDKFRPAFSESFLRAALGRLGCPVDETSLFRSMRPFSSRNSFTLMNHWSVARKITGFLQRQQCG